MRPSLLTDCKLHINSITTNDSRSNYPVFKVKPSENNILMYAAASDNKETD